MQLVSFLTLLFFTTDHLEQNKPAKIKTWIVGHSLVRWAAQYAEQQIYGRSLGLCSKKHEVVWWGKSGMRWGNLLPCLTDLYKLRGGYPDLLIIHLGENDLVKLSGLTLMQYMKRDLEMLKSGWGETDIVWTEFLPSATGEEFLSIKQWTKLGGN